MRVCLVILHALPEVGLTISVVELVVVEFEKGLGMCPGYTR